MKRLAIISCLILSLFRLNAQMTLNDCLLYAREHSFSNLAKQNEAKIAGADRQIGLSEMMPYVGLSANGSLSFGRNIDPGTNTYDTRQTLGSGIRLELSLPVFDGLVRLNNLKALRMAEAGKRESTLAEEDRVSMEVIRNYFNVAYCRALVKQVERQLQRDSIDLSTVRKEETLGTKSGADVAEMRAIVAADRYELTNQQNLLQKAYIDLKAAIGMPFESDLILNIDTADNLSIGNAAIRKLPEIAEAELKVKELQYSLRAARGGYSPHLSFNAGVSTSYYRMLGEGSVYSPFARQLRDNMGEYVSISLSLPVFDGFATRNKVKRAKLNLNESKIRLEETLYKINVALEKARLDHKAAGEELRAARERLEAEQTAYKGMRRKFELGMVSTIDLYTTAAKMATAEANLTGKMIQLQIAEITLRFYQGYPLINEQ